MLRRDLHPSSIRGLALVAAPVALLAVGWLSGAEPDRADDGRHVVAIAGDDGDAVTYVSDGGSVYVVGSDDDQTAYLGVQLREETEHPEGGARITDVVEDSPASEAGLEEGDIVVGFDGHVVRGPVGLTKRIHARGPGDTVTVEVLRDGRTELFEIELGRRSDSLRRFSPFGGDIKIEIPEIEDRIHEKMRGLGRAPLFLDDCAGEDCALRYYYKAIGKPKLGVQLVEATPELRRHLGGDGEVGVLVSKVLSGTPAERSGIEVGDLIVGVDGEDVEDATDLRRALHGKTGETFEVQVIRRGSPRTIQVTIPEPEDDRPTGPRAHLPRPAPHPPAAALAPRVEGIASTVPAPRAPCVGAPTPELPAPPPRPAVPAPRAPRTVAAQLV